jgi:AcrR family transcriptional regulator
MPKIAKDRMEENQRRIMAAALELFTRQGFHGTNIREIAEKVGVSTGAIYTYYSSKEGIFEALVRSYRERTDEWLKSTCEGLKDPLSKDDLKRLASEVRSLLYGDPRYLLLIYIDVVEFQNQHFAETFRNVPENFRRLMGPSLRKTAQDAGWRGEDPAIALASIYLSFFTSASVERLYRGNRHLGVSDEQAAERFISILCGGLWKEAAAAGSDRKRQGSAEARTKRQIEALQQPVRERIELMRLLSGRLWNSPPDTPAGDSAVKAEPMLFVPKISRARIDQTQLRIEAAALEVFTRQGFHSTRMREIAEKAEVSSGLIYVYFPNKEALFTSLVKNYRTCMRAFRGRVLRALENPFSKNDLRLLAFAVRSMVYDDAEYQLLMFIDVIEFQNQHFADTFYKMPEQFRHIMGPALNKVKRQKGWCGEDPAFALTAIYLYMFTYFTVERLMQRGKQHLGIPDEQAIERFIDFLSHGLWRSEAALPVEESQSKQAPAPDRSQRTPLTLVAGGNGARK